MPLYWTDDPTPATPPAPGGPAMTRDEQIAQLKPGDVITIRDNWGHQTYRVLWEVRGIFVAYHSGRADGGIATTPIGNLILPDPPPAPKAVPGKFYRHRISTGATRVGTADGKLWSDSLYYSTINFDPAIWTPVEEAP